MDFIIEKGKAFDKLACISDEKLMRVDFVSSSDSITEGNIYRSTVKKINQNLNSAIVDLGICEGYLQDNYSLVGLKKGDELLLQVKRPGIKNKMPKLTRELSLMGRYCVMFPYGKDINFSNRIEDDSWKLEIKAYLKQSIGTSVGIVIRTLAYKVSENEIKNDIDKLFDIWNEIEKQSKLGLNNKLIYTQYDPIEQFIFKSNPESIDKLICNDKQLLKHIENSLKSKIQIITPTFIDTEFLFDYLKLTSQIRNLFQKKVEVNNNISLFVESTEACHIIDVNSGNANYKLGFEKNALEINLIAADEAVRQILLRDLSGIILIDFMDMKENQNKIKLINKVTELLKKDGKKSSVTSITELGIMQIIRKRDKENIYERYTKSCPLCDGLGKVLTDELYFNQLFIELSNATKHTNQKQFKIKIPYILNEKIKQYLHDIENELKITIEAEFIDVKNLTLKAHF